MNSNDHSNLELAIKQRLEKSSLPSFDAYLYQKIRTRISVEQSLSELRPRLWSALAMLALGLGVLAVAVDVSFKAFALTPTAKFFSLIFTDFGQVAGNWQDFSYSILESLPLGAVAFLVSAFVGALVVFDFSARQFSSFRKLFLLKH